MTGDEIDAGIGTAPAVFIEVAAAAEPRSEFRDDPAVAFPEPPHGVAIFSVPFRPADGKIADLVAALAEVPGFGDQFDLGQDRILMDDIEKRAEFIDLVQFPRQRAGEVEPETIDV